MLALPDAAAVSLVGQLAAMTLAALVGRFVVKTRGMIWLVGLVGAVGAVLGHVAVDGQAALVLLIFTPLNYLAAVSGRTDLAPTPAKRTWGFR